MLENDGLPPLQSLLAFELCARYLSFTAAARELGTTQPAVSQQIRNLEAYLRVPLFSRIYRGVELTEAGQQLYAATKNSFKELRQTCEKIHQRPVSNRINVATDFAFAAFGLMPRFSEFRQMYEDHFPGLDIQLQTSQTLIDLAGSNVDVAVVFGDGDFQGFEAQMLVPEEVYPVCSPKLLQQAGLTDDYHQMSFDELMSLPFLKLNQIGGKRWLDFDDFILQQHMAHRAKASIMESDNFTLLIQAAIAGQGVCLAWSPLVNDFIRDGVLVAFSQFKMTSPHGYHLVLTGKNENSQLIQTFVNWLRASLK